MIPKIRIAVLSILLIIACYQLPAVRKFEEDIADRFDHRPVVRVLFIGNSRTAVNALPLIMRKVADSAHSTYKYDVVMYAPGGVSLQDHWYDRRTQELLTQKWDYVVLQGRSNEQLDANNDASFHTYGRSLANRIKLNGAVPVLFVTWRYADNDPLYASYPTFRTTLHGLIQASYLKLAQETGAQVVNVGAVWERLLSSAPGLSLYYDTNHPSMQGSYLCALMFYRFLSHDDLEHVTYVPEGISWQEAEVLKRAAQ